MLPRRRLAPSSLAALCLLGLGVLSFGAVPASAAPPANDDFANAQVVGPAVPIAVPATTVDATAETDEPNHASNPPQHSVWFS